MKILTMPDLHGKDYWKEVDVDKYDLIVFLGDYTDDYDVSNITILENLKSIISLKKDYPDKIVLLIGNHDNQYIFPEQTYQVSCSGYRPLMYHDLNKLFNDNIDLFQASFQHENYVWTHAGIVEDWYVTRLIPKLIELGIYDRAELTLSNKLNILYKSSLDSIKVGIELFDVGYMRGGIQKVGGIFWADKIKLQDDPLNVNQIVGHTKVSDITTINNVTFTDCLDKKLIFYELIL